MIKQFLHKIYDLPVIVQGAAGSALFWIVQKLLMRLGDWVARLVGHTTEMVSKDKKVREWVHRRFTSRDGLVNYTYGYLYTMSKAMRGLLMGLLFSAIALLFGGSMPLTWGMCLVAAIVYFITAVSWVNPSSKWSTQSLPEHWERVAELERDLFGEVDKHTLEIIARHTQAAQAVGEPTSPTILPRTGQ